MSTDLPPAVFNCEVCGDPAVIHATEVVDGKAKEVHLCEHHSKEWPDWPPPSDPENSVIVLSWAAGSLRNLCDEGNVSELIKALRNSDRDIRQLAAIVLARIGPGAKDAMSALSEMAHDEDESVRIAASWAIDAINK